MVTFDSTQAGTPAHAWAADPRMHDRPALMLDDVSEVLVVAAHPDDETLGAGGLIAECVRRGLAVRVVVVTDGGAGGMAARRARELDSAMTILGATASILGFADGETREFRAEITRALHPIVTGLQPRALIVAPWRGDGHRDHRVVGDIIGEIVSHTVASHRLVEYPVWLWHWADPTWAAVPWTQFTSVTIDAATKRSAIEKYSSQVEGESPVLREDFLEHFATDTELFVVRELEQSYFDAIHARREDPWGFETRWYEKRKRAITLAALPDERYANALEIGCSIGVLTESLAARVDDLLAIDISRIAVERTRAREIPGVRAEQCDVLDEFPQGRFDLIVLSEIGYYFDHDQLRRVLLRIDEALADDGVLVTCHWRHPVSDYPTTGDDVHRIVRQSELTLTVEHTEEDFVLGVFRRDSRSVAKRSGLR